MKNFKTKIKILISILVFFFGIQAIYATWTGTTDDFPLGNTSAPLNVSPLGQSKIGGLILNTGGAPSGLLVHGTTTFNGPIEAGGSIGTAGQVLQSGGPGNAPTWGSGGGAINATEYCDENGLNCFTAASTSEMIDGGGSGGGIGMVFLGSVNDSGDAITVSEGANYTVVAVTGDRNDDETWTGEIELHKTGKTSGTLKWSQVYSSSGNSYIQVSASWVGDTVSLSCVNSNSTQGCNVSGTGHFYKSLSGGGNQVFLGAHGGGVTGEEESDQTYTISIDTGFVPRYYEAIIVTDGTWACNWGHSSNCWHQRQTALVKGIIGGNSVYTISTDRYASPTIGLDSLDPYFDKAYTGSSYSIYQSSSANTLLPQIRPWVGTNTYMQMTGVKANGTNIEFNWNLTAGNDGGALRYKVLQLEVWE